MPERSNEKDVILHASPGDKLLQGGSFWTITDDFTLHVEIPITQIGERLHQEIETLLPDEATDSDAAEGSRRGSLGELEFLEINSMPHEMHGVPIGGCAQGEQMIEIRPCAGGNKRRLGNELSQR